MERGRAWREGGHGSIGLAGRSVCPQEFHLYLCAHFVFELIPHATSYINLIEHLIIKYVHQNPFHMDSASPDLIRITNLD